MILWVKENRCKEDEPSTTIITNLKDYRLGTLMKSPIIIEEAKLMKQSHPVSIKSESEILYVHQNEMVMLPLCGIEKTKLPRFIGTSEMTSCQSVLIKSCKGSVFGHLDGSYHGFLTRDFFHRSTEFLKPILQPNECLYIYMIGGFCDDRNLSKDLTVQILTQLIESELTFELRLLCCYRLNDIVSPKDNLHHPVITGIVYDIWQDVVLPAAISSICTGPLSILRSSYTWSITSSQRMHSIFDPCAQCISLSPFTFSRNVIAHLKHFENAHQSDLESYSTTPKQESEDFYYKLRLLSKMFRVFSPEKDVFNNGCLNFYYDTISKSWKPSNMAAISACCLPWPSLAALG